MKLTVLGSGGCMVVPKPLCRCRVCEEAREKGGPYERTGPSLYIWDERLLIDTPAEIIRQLNRSRIDRVDGLLYTHLDPDHVEGMRVVEQISLDFRTWKAYPGRGVKLLLPRDLHLRLRAIRSVYGPLIDFYETQGFVETALFDEKAQIGEIFATALPVHRGDQIAYVYVFEKGGKKAVYAPCDIRPFPEEREEVRGADLLVIQPGIFEQGLKHGFVYPADHISRKTLYTFQETLALAERVQAANILFVHLEEYWNRSYDDYKALEARFENVRFAHDGMTVEV